MNKSKVNLLNVRNPRTGDLDYQITPAGTEELKQRSEELRFGQGNWTKVGVEARVEVVQQWKKVLINAKEEVVQATFLDTGRLKESIVEFDAVIGSVDRWCQQAPDLIRDKTKDSANFPNISIQNESIPYELVGIISPWNFPLLLTLIDAIPALLAGSAVIIKPSEITPRFIKPLLETVEEVPELKQVINIVEGAGQTGADLIKYVDLICFTGSVKTGRKVGRAAADYFIPSFLELGGKDPAIVLESADINRASTALLYASVIAMGQSCLSIERIYVADAVHDEFVTSLTKKANDLSLAYPDINGDLGPIISEAQADIIAEHLDDAIEKGATILCGGKVENLGGGNWCRPTVITNVNHSMKLMTEETFGPIMPVMSFRVKEEAIELANDTNLGLSGAVFAETVEEGREVANYLTTGAISINDAGLTGIIHEGEKNSFKFSGIGGSRMGEASISRFIRKKLYLINNSKSKQENSWWF